MNESKRAGNELDMQRGKLIFLGKAEDVICLSGLDPSTTFRFTLKLARPVQDDLLQVARYIWVYNKDLIRHTARETEVHGKRDGHFHSMYGNPRFKCRVSR